MKTKLILFLFLLAIIPSCFAQISTFPLADYARPELLRKTASIGGSFNFNNSNLKTNQGILDTDLNLTGVGRWRDTKFVNSGIYQIQSGTGIDLRLSFAKDNDLRGTKNIYELRPIIQRDYSRKKFNENQGFLELSYELDLDFSETQFRDTLLNETRKERRLSSFLSVPLYVGKGRLELINHAWHALTILEFLQEQNLLKGEASHENIKAFADRISEIRQFRNTDIRLENIAEFEALSKHLVDNELINPEEYRVFAVLLDAWQYESFVHRLSGKEWKFGVIPSVGINNRLSALSSGGNLKLSELHTNVLASIAYNIYQPISIDWQFNVENSVGFGPMWDINLIEDTNIQNLLGEIQTNWEIWYIPNQRTYYSIGLSGVYDFINPISKLDTTPTHELNCQLIGEYRYYVSPQLSWSLTGSIRFLGKKQVESSYSNINSFTFSTSYRLY